MSEAEFDPFTEIQKKPCDASPETKTETATKEDPVLTEALNHLKVSLDTLCDVIRSLDRWQRLDLDKALAFFKRHRGIRDWPWLKT